MGNRRKKEEKREVHKFIAAFFIYISMSKRPVKNHIFTFLARLTRLVRLAPIFLQKARLILRPIFAKILQ
jgi:hypothetical protein